MPLATQFAERIHALRYEDLTPVAREWVGHAFIDTVGVTIAGVVEDGPQILMRMPGMGAPGPCVVIGTDRRMGPLDATLVNGTASHVLDYDDMVGSLAGHASAMLVPPLLALGEYLGSSGRDLAVAYVAGFETACRIGRGVHHHHYDKGWHPTSTLGIFGTVAATARLLNLTVDQTAAALGLAASLAGGLKSNFGTMTKSLHVGHGTRSGLFATLMVREGFTANPATFEHKQGFLEVFNGPGTYDASRMLGDWYAPFECDGPAGIGLKPYPCCGSTHPAIETVADLAKKYDIDPEQVVTLEVMPHSRRLPHTDNPDPQTSLGAKFSQQYCAARALVSRSAKLEHFEGDAPFDPVVRSLLQRTTARPHPDWAADAPLQWGVEVVVTMKDGRRLVSRVDDYKKFGPGSRTMPREAMWEKFEDCAKRSLPRAQIAPLFEQLERIDRVENLTEVARLMQTPGTTRAAAE